MANAANKKEDWERGTGGRGLLATLSLALVVTGCAARKSGAGFRVVKADPEYLLRAPDAKQTPFREVPALYTGVGEGWVELKPGMELRIENAYYREGAPKHGLANYVGTEVVRYHLGPTGELRQTAFESHVPQRPAD
jgi:hypothetical protein